MYLGGATTAASVQVPVYNTGSTTINRGCVCSFYPDADGDYSSYTIVYPAGANTDPVYRVPVRNWVTSTQDLPYGVAVGTIPAGKSGMVIVSGMALVKTDGNVDQNEELELSTGGILVPYSSGTKYGRAILTDGVSVREVDFGTNTATFALALVQFNIYPA